MEVTGTGPASYFTGRFVNPQGLRTFNPLYYCAGSNLLMTDGRGGIKVMFEA
jgi:hypothetical protein